MSLATGDVTDNGQGDLEILGATWYNATTQNGH